MYVISNIYIIHGIIIDISNIGIIVISIVCNFKTVF